MFHLFRGFIKIADPQSAQNMSNINSLYNLHTDLGVMHQTIQGLNITSPLGEWGI